MEKQKALEELDIQQYFLVLQRRWKILLAVIITSVGFSGFAILRQKPQYQATGMLLFKSDRISSLTKAGEKIGDLESLIRENNPLNTQAVIVNSQPVIKEVIKTLNLKDNQGKFRNPETLLIKVEPIVGTDVLKVSHASDNPKLAAKIVNQVMATYAENNVESNRTQVTAAGEFIKKQLPSSRKELESAAEALRQFKNKNKIVQLEQESSSAITSMAKLDEEINQATANLAETLAQESQVGNQIKTVKNQAIEITSLNQIPGVQEVLSELQRTQSRLALERVKYTNNHPNVVYLENQEKTLKSLLNQRTQEITGNQLEVSLSNLQVGKIREDLANQYVQLKTKRQGLQKKIAALQGIQQIYQKRLNAIPNLEKKQSDLERKLSVAKLNHENLNARLQEIQVAEKQTIGNAKIIQPAQIPQTPMLSKKSLMLALGSLFAGSLLGIAGAFFVDLIDRSLKTVKEAENFFGWTLLGLIPRFEANHKSVAANITDDGISERVIVNSSPRTIIHEAYQMLQANLNFISHKKVRAIAITSCVPGEGKSEVSANLAAILAQAGRRVLLIDADMRKPSQHHLWGLINSVGLSNVIVGQNDFPQAVQRITSNLFVLTAGVQPPNPLGLIDSEGMTELIRNFAQDYDYILFDTPPLAGTADAAVLGKILDGVLLVTRPGVVDSVSATAAKSLLERSGANILGMIANGVNLKQEPDSYFYYSKPRWGQSTSETDTKDEQWIYK